MHVLMGDGECQEGSNFEALCMAERLNLWDGLKVHVDVNGYQGSDADLTKAARHLVSLFPIRRHQTLKGQGIARFEKDPVKSVHLVTDEDYAQIMEELSV